MKVSFPCLPLINTITDAHVRESKHGGLDSPCRVLLVPVVHTHWHPAAARLLRDWLASTMIRRRQGAHMVGRATVSALLALCCAGAQIKLNQRAITSQN